MLFSQRNHLLDEGTTLKRFRNRTWNVFSTLTDIYCDACSSPFAMNYYDVVSTLMFCIADKLGLDATDNDSSEIYDILHKRLNNTPQIIGIFDFIEAHLESLFEPPSLLHRVKGINIKRVQDIALEKYSQLLKDENQPYQLYNYHLIPLVNDSELKEIEAAATTRHNSVNRHIEKAWLFFSNRKSPDYENSVKESISAVEAMCCIITGLSGSQATLGAAIKKLKDNGIHIHGAMESAFSSLYGYTSDETGIRHGGIDFKDAPAEDAKYMLISCSAFVNYLIEKWTKVNSEG